MDRLGWDGPLGGVGCLLRFGTVAFGLLVTVGLAAVAARDVGLLGPLGRCAPLLGVPFLLLGAVSLLVPEHRWPDAPATPRRQAAVRVVAVLFGLCVAWFCVSVVKSVL